MDIRMGTLAVVCGAVVVGCADTTPPPPRASIPPTGTYTDRGEPSPKPLPGQSDSYRPPFAPPFADAPLVSQQPPEEVEFVRAYEAVGSPRLAVFVNRTSDGRVVPNDRTDTAGTGEYDEVAAKRIDYDAVENVMQDWLSARGHTLIVSPRYTEAEMGQLQKGDRSAFAQLSDERIDVLVIVTARPSRQSEGGIGVRLIAEAVNTKGGESVGRSFVDLPPPMDKPAVNEYTRFLARKLMSDMTNTWRNPPAGRAEASTTKENPPENESAPSADREPRPSTVPTATSTTLPTDRPIVAPTTSSTEDQR